MQLPPSPASPSAIAATERASIIIYLDQHRLDSFRSSCHEFVFISLGRRLASGPCMGGVITTKFTNSHTQAQAPLLINSPCISGITILAMHRCFEFTSARALQFLAGSWDVVRDEAFTKACHQSVTCSGVVSAFLV